MKKVFKPINFDRFRLWIYPTSLGWDCSRKTLKPLGFILYFGRVKISFTILKSKQILFNPYTLQRIDLEDLADHNDNVPPGEEL